MNRSLLFDNIVIGAVIFDISIYNESAIDGPNAIPFTEPYYN